MNLRLSHSQSNTFAECPTKYKYHYIDKLRPNSTGGALIFGSAIDKALESLLKGEDYRKTFKETMDFQEILGVKTYLPTTPLVSYSDSDFDWDLCSDPDSRLEQILDKKSIVGLDNLAEEEKVILNKETHKCLYEKGLILLEQVKKEILPQIEKVYSTQEKIELTNESGDTITGFADFVGKWRGIEKPIVFDFKTSSKEYADDSVVFSPQLTLYVHALSDKHQNTRMAGFIVLNKRLNKKRTKKCTKCGHEGKGSHRKCDNIVNGDRCNGEWEETTEFSANIQVLINEIPEQTENIVLDNFEAINQMVKNGIFSRNFSSCKKQWGSKIIPCPYFDLCYNGSKKGLKYVEEKKSGG